MAANGCMAQAVMAVASARRGAAARRPAARRWAWRTSARMATDSAEREAPSDRALPSPAEPKTFTPDLSKAPSLAASAVMAVARMGGGALAHGYRVEVVKDDDSAVYGVRLPGGNRLQETSSLSSYPKPAQPLILYEFQGCPFCAKVREAVSNLGLDVTYRPCPQGGALWRPMAKELGGKAQFPYLVDPNNALAGGMYESSDIVDYLYETYGPGKEAVPLGLKNPLTILSLGLGLAPRAGAGSKAKLEGGNPRVSEDMKPLEVWLYEASPFCRIVKEELCAREVPHTQFSVPRGYQEKRQALFDAQGLFQAPFLRDPNNGFETFESSAILRYLEDYY